MEFKKRLAIIPLRIDRRTAIRRQMRQELVDPLVMNFRLGILVIHSGQITRIGWMIQSVSGKLNANGIDLR